MRVFQILLWILGIVLFLGLVGWLFGPTVSWQTFRSVDTTTLPLEEVRLPEGFTITEFARVENARSLSLGPEGVVFVGSRTAGHVHVILDEDLDGVAERTVKIAEDLFMPNGVAYRDGDLYVAEVNRIIRFPDILQSLEDSTFEVIYDGYPDDRHHGWKFIRFGPDGLLYVPVGAPCNVCDDGDPYNTITRLNVSADQPTPEVFARGIRNTVGFDWSEDDILWFTDNGRDLMGNDIPPDEINRAPEQGLHFGFPFCHGGTIQDPDFDERGCEEFVAPVHQLGPHVAALGMRFYAGGMFPETYTDQIFIAEHGSWNRDVPIGYRVMLVQTDGANNTSYESFADGWLREDGSSWGRPVDVAVYADGSLLVSDDKADAIYRIAYGG